MNRKKKRTQQMCTHKQETHRERERERERENNSGSEEQMDMNNASTPPEK